MKIWAVHKAKARLMPGVRDSEEEGQTSWCTAEIGVVLETEDA